MASASKIRPMSDAEREFVAGLLNVQSSRSRFWKLSLENFVVMWAVATLVVIVGWLLLAWVTKLVLDWRIGMSSPVAIWVAGLGVPLCGVIAGVSTIRWVKTWPDYRSNLESDLAEGVVSEERYKISGVKRFQEPEHGGLIYFLRTTDDRSLVLYDDESQRVDDSLKSTFRPSEDLVMVRAPSTGFVIEKVFSGAPLSLPNPIQLVAPPNQWPENEAFTDIPWDDLERRLGEASA